MRFKKQKRHRKVVRFYTACFGFRQPFKVFCDGTFVHHLLSNRIMPADNALAKTLGAPVKLFTTSCVLSELKFLGQSYSEAFDAASKLHIARCDHEKRKSAEACIIDVIGESNPEHFFVATQDTGLRSKLQEIPGVPLIFGLRNALFMEQPSALQRQFVKSSEEERLHMSEHEYNLLKKRLKYKVETEETNEPGDLEDQNLEMQVLKKRRTASDLKDKAQFKRKKPKGPNPLSCMKKKTKPSHHPISEKKKDDDSTVKSRIRKRKRSRGVAKTPANLGTP